MSRSKTEKSDSSLAVEKKSLPEKHLGIIAQRVLVYWKLLPESVRCFYDADDMIGDVVLQIWRRSPRYDPKRAKESTWVWHVADNQCRSILSRYRGKKYASLVKIELTPKIMDRASFPAAGVSLSAADAKRQNEARDAVERVIGSSTDAARVLLSQIFSGKIRGTFFTSTFEELRKSARLHSACLRDFELVYKHATA